jgi:hypothetical protein
MAENYHTRLKRKLGNFAVPCVVSERWLEFSQGGSVCLPEGEALIVSVMTRGTDDKPKKLCEVIVTRESLLEVLNLIEKPAKNRRKR